MALRTILGSRLVRTITAPALHRTPANPPHHYLRQLHPPARCWASSQPQRSTTDGGSAGGAHRTTTDVTKPAPRPSDAEEKDEEEDARPGAIGGFMRGLIGGQAVAADDAYVAEAKAQGVEVPPPPPQRRSDLVALKRRKRAEDEDWAGAEETIRDRLFSRFSGSAFMRGAFDAKERISERLDESENPVVNFFRNAYHSVFAENEMAMVIREIREDDAAFTVSEFLREVEDAHVPAILGAYLAGDRARLRAICTEEAYAMLNASIREREQEQVTIDPNILAINDVELSAGRLLEDAPVLIVTFSAQQINCLRNPAGEVVEGKEDEIRAVYYAMAFVREVEYEDDVPTGGGMAGFSSGTDTGEGNEGAEEKNTDGPPPWKMMEMCIHGAHSTI